MVLINNCFPDVSPPFNYTKNDIRQLYVPPTAEEAIIWLSGERLKALKIYSERTGIRDIILCAWFFFVINEQYLLVKKLMTMFLNGKNLEEILSD